MPKSRGRRKGAKNRPVRRSPRPLQPADLLLRDAREIIELDDVLTVETWASSWLGQAWSTAALTEREPEHQLCLRVTGRACTAASPDGLGALAALARVAPAADSSMLTETVAILAETQPVPAWHIAAAWTPTAAWRAVDVWDSERVLFVDYDGPQPPRPATRGDLLVRARLGTVPYAHGSALQCHIRSDDPMWRPPSWFTLQDRVALAEAPHV